jgi:hypothetical protein
LITTLAKTTSSSRIPCIIISSIGIHTLSTRYFF